jgi:hypothetical protein
MARLGELVGTFLVERYWPGVTVEAFADAVLRLEEAVAALRRDGTAIRTVGSTLVSEDEAAYWVVDAPSREAVALAWARAGVPAERIVRAIDVRPPIGATTPRPGDPAPSVTRVDRSP